MTQLKSVLYTISTNYTDTLISSPSHVSRSFNNDLKYVTGTILPGLEILFLESRSCVEQRVLKDLYPAFVKHKLVLATTASLASNLRLPEAEYPGLGSAFCITDGQDGDRIKYALDEFATVLGRSRNEIIHGNVATLQSSTNPEASLRMQHAMHKKQECVELVVSYRKDGEPFWNLVYLCPLPGTIGKQRCCLHCYINVSNRIRTSTDVLNLLAKDSLRTDIASGKSPAGSTRFARSRSPAPVDKSDDGQTSSRGKDRDCSRSSSSHGLFNLFRKATNAPHTSHHNRSDSALARPGRFPEPPIPRLCEDHVLSSPQLETNTVYSRVLLLRHFTGVRPKLLVSHASPSALDLLNPALIAEAILDKDVFKMLSDEARSPSVTKSFTSSIKKGALNAGERLTTEMLLGEKEGRRGMMQVTCFWTPLRGEKGVDWVVLVLVPSG